jgi:hypothetical protein
VKICLLKSNWQRHGVCHSLLSALPRILIKSFKKVTGSATNLSLMKIFLFLKIFFSLGRNITQMGRKLTTLTAPKKSGPERYGPERRGPEAQHNK